MIWAVLITAAAVAVTGLACMFLVPRFLPELEWHISWREFIAGLVAAYFVAIPAVFAVGDALSTADALRYEEFYNGVETSATFAVTDCYPGSSGSDESSGHSNCDYEYPTGETYSYTEVYYVTETECDSDGDCTSHQVRKERTAWADIFNPYATKEYDYYITDSLGGAFSFPVSYVKDGEGYGGGSIPSDIPRGDPPEWLDAKTHLDEGDPRPVTRIFDYDNYILASQDDMLKPFSENVEQYLDEGILPDHTANIMGDPLYGYNNSFADKVSFVDVKVDDEAAWQKSLMTFNAALGSKLRGDLHLVLIDDSLVDSPTDYLNALKAHWLGEDFGRRAIAKNAIIVVAGVRGDEVTWGMASTGMPFGNEVMLQGIKNFLPGTPLDPNELIGSPRTVYSPDSNDDGDDELEVTVSRNPGVLERVVLQDFPFERACMECADDEGEIGYDHLVAQIDPEPWQFAIMIVVVSLLAMVWWYYAGAYEFLNWSRWGKSSRDEEVEHDSRSMYASRTSKKGRRSPRSAYYPYN